MSKKVEKRCDDGGRDNDDDDDDDKNEEEKDIDYNRPFELTLMIRT